MGNEIVINFIGIVIGTFGGILASSKLVNYRLEQLERKVDKHNTIIERTFKCEARLDVLESKE